MPFKSEAQRRYLWANEPEIARDWADTYGSRIEAALGGIMASRVGLNGGGGSYQGSSNSGSGNKNGGNKGGGNMIGAGPLHGVQGPTLATSGNQDGPYNIHGGLTVKDALKEGARKQQLSQFALNQAADKQYPLGGPQQKNFIQQGMDAYQKYGFIPNAIRFGTSLFGPKQPKQPTKTEMTAAMEDAYNTKQPTLATSGGGDGQGQQQYYPPWWEEDQYAQSILGDEEELDIDTSTGDMEEWIQRFRVKDPYRQDRGTLDPQIKEYVSKLYT